MGINFKNRKILLGFIVCLTVGLAFLISVILKKPSPINQITSPRQTPKISSYVDQDVKIVSNLNRLATNIPSQLSFYHINTQPLSKTEAFNLAKNLSFTSEVFESKNPKTGTNYFWSEESQSLWFYPSLKLIQYDKQTSVANTPFASESELEKIAVSFLKDKGFIKDSNVKLVKIQYINSLSEDFVIRNKDNSTEAELFLTQAVDNKYPIVSSINTNGNIHVRINRNSQVVYVSASPITILQQSENTLQIKSFDELVNSLSQAEIQDLDITLSSFIDTITVKEARIGYLKEDSTTQNTLQPIFILTGESTINGEKTEIILYLPAAK